MRTQHIVIFFITISLFAGCSISGTTPDKEWELVGTTWWLEAFQDEKGTLSDIGAEEFVLVFSDPDTLWGKSFRENQTGDRVRVNSYFSTYSADNTSITVKEGFSTHVGITPGSRYEEYFNAKNDAISYKIEEDQLTLFYGSDGNKALLFKAGEDVTD